MALICACFFLLSRSNCNCTHLLPTTVTAHSQCYTVPWTIPNGCSSSSEDVPLLTWILSFEPLLCWKVKCVLIFSCLTEAFRIYIKTDWCMELSKPPSILIRTPGAAAEKQLHNMMLPSPCFTVDDKLVADIMAKNALCFTRWFEMIKLGFLFPVAQTCEQHEGLYLRNL